MLPVPVHPFIHVGKSSSYSMYVVMCSIYTIQFVLIVDFHVFCWLSHRSTVLPNSRGPNDSIRQGGQQVRVRVRVCACVCVCVRVCACVCV